MTEEDKINEDEYIQYLNTFFSERIKASLKRKDTKCPGCDKEKIFTIQDNELIYSCGGRSGKCGTQFKIKLAQYINYQTLKIETNEFFKRAHNYDTIKDLIDVKKEIEQYEQFSQFRKKIMKNTQKTYIRQNNLKERKAEIENLHEQRINILAEQNKLMSLLRDKDDSKHEDNLRSYIKLSNKLNLIYKRMREINDIPINNHIMMEQHKVTDKSTQYQAKEEKREKKKSKKNKEKKEVEQEIKDDDTGDPINYYSKSKDNKWLSAFNIAEPFTYEGNTYPSTEHAFHAQKLDPSDDRREEYIALFTDKDSLPSDAKKNGGKGSFKKRGYTIREDWDTVRLKLMYETTKAYYEQNDRMRERLLQTGDRYLKHYGPRIDDFWGEKKDGSGQNHHGKILMRLRDEFRK